MGGAASGRHLSRVEGNSECCDEDETIALEEDVTMTEELLGKLYKNTHRKDDEGRDEGLKQMPHTCSNNGLRGVQRKVASSEGASWQTMENVGQRPVYTRNMRVFLSLSCKSKSEELAKG